MTRHTAGTPFVIDLSEAPIVMDPNLERVLAEFGLLPAFRARPAHEQEAYLSLIAKAGRPEVRDMRIADLLDELALTWDGYRGRHVDFAPSYSTHKQEGKP
jgi:hypothetical protein